MESITRFRGSFGFLSNFSPCTEFEYKGIWFTNVEAFYQSQKTKDLTEQRKFERITGIEAKRLSRELFVRNDWQSISIKVMRYALRRKFEDLRLKELLIKTGNAKLYEGNWHNDTFWGVSLHTHKGCNHLGKLLMALRKELQMTDK
jgi:ribA/ribD-fused uncharacterized protein